jgi:hypothetical protein
MGDKSNAPVIIKRKKVGGGDGHHGGAWKVAMFWSCSWGRILRRGFRDRPRIGAGRFVILTGADAVSAKRHPIGCKVDIGLVNLTTT